MPILKLPTPEEVAADTSILDRLPADKAQLIVQQFRDIEKQLDRELTIPPDPVSMATSYPRYRWMDVPHARYVSLEVAHTVNTSQAAMVFMPPRHLKSTIVSMWTPFWALCRDPELRILMISNEATLASQWGRAALNLVRAYGADHGLRVAKDKQAIDNWELESGGGMISLGAFGTIAGKSASGLLIVDDVVRDEEAARSQIQRENLWTWWESTVIQRIEPSTATFVIGTHYHEDDLYGRILKKAGDDEGLFFNVVKIPAIATEDDVLGRAPGEGLWLKKNPQSFYENRRKHVSAYTWNSVYQQSPTPPGGNMVDPEWWRFYIPGKTEPKEYDQEIQSWDLALDSQKKTDSYHCGFVLSRKGNEVYVRAAYHEHSKIDDVVGTIRSWSVSYRKARQKIVERSIAGPAVVQMMRHRTPGMLVWPPKGRQKNSKEGLLNACVPDIRSGHIYLPINEDGTKSRWVEEMIEELRQFPRAAHDDYVDALTQGLDFLLPSVRAYDDEKADAEEKRLLGEAAEIDPAEATRLSHDAHSQRLKAILDKLAGDRIKQIKRSLGQDDPNWIEYPGAPEIPSSTLARIEQFMRTPSTRKHMC